MRNIIFIILLFPLLCSALVRIDSFNIDSITTYKIDEVVIEAAKQYAIGNGIASVPTKKIKQHSINVVNMLSKMIHHISIIANYEYEKCIINLLPNSIVWM